MSNTPLTLKTMGVFISYSRADIDIAKYVNRRLESEPDYSFSSFMDEEDIKPGRDWRREIFAGIDQSDVFLFFLSAHSLKSPYCHLELNYALECGKRIIPLLLENFGKERMAAVESELIDPAWTDDLLTTKTAVENWRALRRIQFLPFFDAAKREHATTELIQAMLYDDEHVRLHTAYLNAANQWSGRGKKADRLLMGAQLAEAAAWLESAADKSPAPQPLHTEYILASLGVQRRERRKLAVAIGVALLLMIALLAGLLLSQIEVARSLAQADFQLRQTSLSAVPQLVQNGDLAAARQLILDTRREGEPLTSAVVGMMRDLLPARAAYKHTDRVYAAALSPDADLVLMSVPGARLLLWAWESDCDAVSIDLPPAFMGIVPAIGFSPDGRFIAASAPAQVNVWEVGAILNAARAGQPMPAPRTLPLEPFDEYASTSLAFNPAGDMLAVGGGMGIHLFNADADFAPLAHLQHDNAELDSVYQVIFASDQRLLSLSNFGNVTVWDVAARTYQSLRDRRPNADSDALFWLDVSPDGLSVWALTNFSSLCHWGAEERVIHANDCQPAPESQSTTYDFALTPDGEYVIAAGAAAGEFTLRSVDTPMLSIGDLRGQIGLLSSIQLVERYAVTVTDEFDRSVRVWEWGESLRSADLSPEQLFDALADASAPTTCNAA